jgi:hypothetical protein
MKRTVNKLFSTKSIGLNEQFSHLYDLYQNDEEVTDE